MARRARHGARRFRAPAGLDDRAARQGHAVDRQHRHAGACAAVGRARTADSAAAPHPRLWRFPALPLSAAGKLDAIVESDVNILDIAALAVIVREAGGQFSDLNGGELNLDTRTVLATNGRLHGAFAGLALR